MSGETPRCPFCSAAVESVEEREGWWARPCGHALGRRRYEELRAQIDAARPPWRFDVPPVPDHVMAMTGPGDGGPRVWVRGQRRRWAEWPLTDEPDEWISFVEVIYRTGYGGLVECPDPRAAS